MAKLFRRMLCALGIHKVIQLETLLHTGKAKCENCGEVFTTYFGELF